MENLLSSCKIVPDFYSYIVKKICAELDKISDPLPKDCFLKLECRIGRIVDKRTMERIKLPVSCETILDIDSVYFVPGMTQVRKI